MYKVLLVNLGCPKNQKDGELALSLLLSQNFVLTNLALEADLILINTCSFIDDAKKESISEILNYAEYKKNGSCKALFVMGCLSELHHKDLLSEISEIDAVIGVKNYQEIVNIFNEFMIKKQVLNSVESVGKSSITNIICNYNALDKNLYIPETGRYSSYLKVSEGCNNNCTYCIIPSIRGPLYERSIASIVNEARILVKRGVKELVLVAQDLTANPVFLKKLLKKLINLPKNEKPFWIRLMYCNPWGVDDELIDMIKNEENIVNYIDMPIQHISDSVLKSMNRKAVSKKIRNIVEKLKLADIVIRTTVMTGYPGETDKDFDLLKTFVSEGFFYWMGIFTFSPQEGTLACSLANQIDEKLSLDRRNELDRIQFDITNLNNSERIGKTYTALFDSCDENKIYARFYFQAPLIDGMVTFLTDTVKSTYRLTVKELNGVDLFACVNKKNEG